MVTFWSLISCVLLSCLVPNLGLDLELDFSYCMALWGGYSLRLLQCVLHYGYEDMGQDGWEGMANGWMNRNGMRIMDMGVSQFLVREGSEYQISLLVNRRDHLLWGYVLGGGGMEDIWKETFFPNMKMFKLTVESVIVISACAYDE